MKEVCADLEEEICENVPLSHDQSFIFNVFFLRFKWRVSFFFTLKRHALFRHNKELSFRSEIQGGTSQRPVVKWVRREVYDLKQVQRGIKSRLGSFF